MYSIQKVEDISTIFWWKFSFRQL